MVDFRKLMRPEDRARLERLDEKRAEVQKMTMSELRASFLHALHNQEFLRGVRRESITYNGALVYAYLPEVLRRYNVTRCPVCGYDMGDVGR